MLGVAVKPVNEQTKPFPRSKDENDMAFAGFLLFFDPPKGGVEETIQSAGETGCVS